MFSDLMDRFVRYHFSEFMLTVAVAGIKLHETDALLRGTCNETLSFLRAFRHRLARPMIQIDRSPRLLMATAGIYRDHLIFSIARVSFVHVWSSANRSKK